MRRSEVSKGMTLYAFTSSWGEFLINVKEVIPSKPSRVRGVIIKVLKDGDGFRAGRLSVGREIEVGIINVRQPMAQELE